MSPVEIFGTPRGGEPRRLRALPAPGGPRKMTQRHVRTLITYCPPATDPVFFMKPS